MALSILPNTSQKTFQNCSSCCYSLWQQTGSTMCFAAVKKPSYGNGVNNFFKYSLAFPPTNYYASTAGYSGEFFTMMRSQSVQEGTIGLGGVSLAVPLDANSDGTGFWFDNYNIPKVVFYIAFKFKQLTENSGLKFYYSTDQENLNSSQKTWIETDFMINGDFFSVEITDTFSLNGPPYSMEITIKAHFLLPNHSLGLQMPGRPNTGSFGYGTVTDSASCFEGSYGYPNAFPGVSSLYRPPPYECSRPFPGVGIAIYKYLFETFGYYILFPSVVGVLQNTGFTNDYGEEVFETYLNIDFRNDVYQFWDGITYYFHCSASSYDLTYQNYIGFKARPLGIGAITITA